MQRIKPPFRADEVGSLLRPPRIKEARARLEKGEITAADLRKAEDLEIEKVVHRQASVGLKLATDGEFRRSWWHFDFLSLAPTSTIKLTFSAPMDAGATEKTISLRPAGSVSDLPVAFSWSADGTALSLVPAGPLPVGKVVSLHVGGSAQTRDGQALGSPANFDYHIALPVSRLRLLRGRLAIAHSDTPLQVPYEALVDADTPLPDVTFDVYTLPGSMLSALGAQMHDWPSALPESMPKNLQHVSGLSTSPGQQSGLPEVGRLTLPNLPAGTYLVAATAQASGGALSDWQLLIVTDRSLSLRMAMFSGQLTRQETSGRGLRFRFTRRRARCWTKVSPRKQACGRLCTAMEPH